MKRDYRADLLRVLACIAVVAIHANSFYHSPFGSVQQKVQTVYAMLTSFAVPAFAMITGAFLLNPQKEESPKEILRKRICPLLAVWVFWAVIYTVYDSVRLSQPLTLKCAVLSIYEGYFHMWYLYMIMLVYLTLPILRHIISNPSVTRWYLVLWFGCAVLADTVHAIPYTTKLADIFQERAFPQFLMGFTGYVLWGRCLREGHISRKNERLLAGLGAAGVIGGTLVSLLISWHQKDTFVLNGSFELPVFLYTTGMFCFFMRCLPNKRKPRMLLAGMAELSLDVWMIHMIWLNTLFIPAFFRELPPVIGIPLLTAACFLCSLISVWIGRRLLRYARRGISKIMRRAA